MSDDEQIAKLEALLDRVRSRARNRAMPPSGNGAARHEPGVSATAKPPSERPASRPQAPPTFSPLETPTPMASFRPSPIPPAPQPAGGTGGAAATSEPPASAPRSPSRPEAPAFFLTPQRGAPVQASLPRPEPSQVRPVEPPPMEVVELEVDPDPSIPPPSLSPPTSGGEALESRSRLVSAPPSSLRDEESEEAEETPSRPSDPTIEVAAADVSHLELEAIDAMIEESERAPTSSRRPISLEAKMSEPDETPLHTPPPESGKLPAASPALTVAFEPPPQPAPAAALAQAEVATFVGRTPAPRTPTFGDLLDASLSL